mgnify:CR=1 FL=1
MKISSELLQQCCKQLYELYHYQIIFIDHDNHCLNDDYSLNMIPPYYSNLVDYFNDLYKLSIDDTVTVHYQGKDYIYKITKIYNEKKTGIVRILRNRNKTSLTLITCTNGDNYHQTIYIAELI